MPGGNHSVEHTNLVNSILLACGKLSDVMIWKVQVGVFRAMENPKRIVKTGEPGHPDILAVLGPDGIAVGIEAKTGNAIQNPAQKAWQKAFCSRGGIYLVARSVDDVLSCFRDYGIKIDVKKNIF